MDTGSWPADGPDSALVAPGRALAACVRAYYWHDLPRRADLTAAQRLTHVPPAPYHALVWLLDGRALLIERGGLALADELPAVFLAGAHRHPYRSMALTPYRSFGLVFQPGALALLSARDMADQLDRVGAAEALLPPDWRALLTGVAMAASHAERVALCEQFLTPRWAALDERQGGWVGLIGDAWRRHARVAAIGALNWTQRHFQRRGRQLTGLTPGEVERMLRVERALRDVRDGRASRAEAAADHGYADQPHFAREVRAHYRRSAGELLSGLDEPQADGDWLLRL